VDKYQRVIQAALALRDELPELLGADWMEADRNLATLIETAIREPGGESTTAIITFLDHWPQVRQRLNELLTGSWRGAIAPVSAPGPGGAAQAAPAPDGYRVVEMLYATDRKATGRPQLDAYFSGERSPSNALAYGKCEVSIPGGHKRGTLESRGMLHWVLKSDPNRHVTVLSLEPLPRSKFADAVSVRLGASDDPQAFVFIHGYNVMFHDAVRRTAQLCEDLAFPGAAICFSWPSRGEFFGYGADGESAQWSAQHLAELVRVLRALDSRIRIHLVAHSMGSRVMAMALQELVMKKENPANSVHQIVLAAPDIDCDVFDQLAVTIRDAGKRVSLYASSNDRALWLSRVLHHGPRAGDSGADVVVRDGIDTIDASQVDSSLLSLGHSYFSNRLSVLTDLAQLIRHDTPPNKRRGLQQAPRGRYWIMESERFCAG
jgi:esterase/lipase superfamily enzyme